MKKKLRGLLVGLVVVVLLPGAFAGAEVERLVTMDVDADIVSEMELTAAPENMGVSAGVSLEPEPLAAIDGEPPLCRAVFFDMQGWELGFCEVSAGDFVRPMDTAPQVEGLVFEYWYDGAGPQAVPYSFQTPIYESVSLFPYYSVAEGPPEQRGGDNTAQQMDAGSLIEGIEQEEAARAIIGGGAGEDAGGGEAAEPPASPPPPMNDQAVTALINDILGGAQSVLPQPETSVADNKDEEAEEDGTEPEDALQIAEEDLPLEEIEEIAPQHLVETSLEADEVEEDIVDPQEEDLTVEETEETAPVPQETSGAEMSPAVPKPTGGREALPLAEHSEGEPYVEVSYTHKGNLTPGTVVTLTAVVHNVPEEYDLFYQWQNDSSGAFADVPGATGRAHTFIVDEYTAGGCRWRVNVFVMD